MKTMHDGTVKAICPNCNVTVTYDVGHGMTECPASSDEVYVYFKGSSLYSDIKHAKQLLMNCS